MIKFTNKSNGFGFALKPTKDNHYILYAVRDGGQLTKIGSIGYPQLFLDTLKHMMGGYNVSK